MQKKESNLRLKSKSKIQNFLHAPPIVARYGRQGVGEDSKIIH